VNARPSSTGSDRAIGGAQYDMLAFIALCLASRVAYSFNDVYTGRLARRHGPLELAAFRGLGLGVTMAPLLFWVNAGAWHALLGRWLELLLMLCITAVANVLQLQAARYLPFGLRAAFVVMALAVCGVAIGVVFLDERFSAGQLGWCALIVGSAVLAAVGDHSSDELVPNIRRGAALALGSATLIAFAALLFARLARGTHPLLVAWAWEFGIGLVLLGPLLWQQQRVAWEPGVVRRLLRVGIASSPTVIGSAASGLALTLGPLGMWSAIAGTQALFTAGLGVLWHGERMGARRWLCFLIGAAGIFGLALTRH
jgi:drug/metabolite transporter (DMT)-like permease